MSFANAEGKARSAAWRISLWGTLAFACGSVLVFLFLNAFVARDIQRRTDAWLSGEVETLGDVAERTPKDRLYGRVVGEIAELASREVPDKAAGKGASNAEVFFLQTTPQGDAALWVGRGDGKPEVTAIRGNTGPVDTPFSVRVEGRRSPYRVAMVPMEDGSRLYLGVSLRDELHVLHRLQLRFLLLWFLTVLLGFGIVFFITRRMLSAVREISEVAARIGESDVSKRVPSNGRNDEIGQLAATLNRMLDRIERSIHQLHTMTDSLAHDLRSPLTAIRAKLEMSLASGKNGPESEAVVSVIDEVDRLTEILNKSLDVAEAEIDALRLHRKAVDLDELVRVMVELYEPCMSERGLCVRLHSEGRLLVRADEGMLHRMVANLFDNEMKHLPAGCTVTVSLAEDAGCASLVLEDNGPGFAAEIRSNPFQARVKGRGSSGHGLGLAFVQAVVGAHSGEIIAVNRDEGGARLTIRLPLTGVGEARMQAVGTGA